MSRPVWTEEELDALSEAEKEDEVWYRRGCGCFAYGCLPAAISCFLPLVLLLG